MSLHEIRRKAGLLMSIDTVSFDVFDTLLFRKQGSWHDLLLELGNSLIKRGLLAKHLEPELFLMLRLNAEEVAHRHSAGDGVYALPLECIYEFLPEQYLGDSTTALRLAQEEFHLEKASAFSLPCTVELIENILESGKRVCFTSNTYFRRDELIDLLRTIGIPDHCLTHVFCSCEYGHTKQRGLFNDVLSELGISPRNLLHCGDNYSVDIAAAEKLGIRTSRYIGAVERWLDGATMSPPKTVSDFLRKCGRFDPCQEPYSDFGYSVLGPMIAGFIVWLLDVARDEGKRCLLFAEREGIFFKSAADLMLTEGASTGSEDIETRVISVSRKAVTPLILEDGPLDLLIDVFHRQLKRGADALNQPLDSAEVQRLKAYLATHLAEPNHTLFVDIGYKGTINRCLNAFLARTAAAPMLGAYLFHSSRSDEKSAPSRGYLSEYNMPVPVLSRSMKGLSFLEQCFMPSTGSVIGYDDAGEPLREKVLLNEKQLAEQGEVQHGILTFLADLLHICNRLNLPVREAVAPRSAVRKELLSLLERPTSGVQELALNWCHEVNFGTSTIIPVSAASVLDLAGPAKEIVQGTNCWLGTSWQQVPFSSGSTTAWAQSSVHLSCTTRRGPIGPGNVTTTHPKDCPLVAHLLISPEGESFLTIRVSKPIISGASGGIRMTLIVAPEGTPSAEMPTLDNLAMESACERIVVIWSGIDCRILRDRQASVHRVEACKNGLFLSFSPRYRGRAALLKLEPTLACTQT